MIVSLKLLLIKIATDGVNLQVENRDFPGVFDYGFPFGHAEIKGYINEADGDLWDGLILGYENFPQNYGETFFTRNLIGMIHSKTGNHKLLFKVPYKRGFTQKKYRMDVRKFIRNYNKKWGNTMTYMSVSELKKKFML